MDLLWRAEACGEKWVDTFIQKMQPTTYVVCCRRKRRLDSRGGAMGGCHNLQAERLSNPFRVLYYSGETQPF